MIVAVVFDLYGTLIRLQRDSRPYEVFAENQFSSPREITKRSLIANAENITAFATGIGADCSQSASLDANLEADLKTAVLFDDTIPCLSKLSGMGLKLGLLSNVATPYKRPFTSLGLEQFFSTAIFSCDIGAKKPDQRAFAAIIAALATSPKSVLMVGDSMTSDIAGAHAMGMKALLLDRVGDSCTPDTIRSLTAVPEVVLQM